MLKTTKKVAVLLLVIFINAGLRAQMSGTYNVPGDFATLSAAITSLNAVGISGPLTINVQAGYAETLTSGLVLTASGTSANPIIFQKSGAGANPLITAHTGTSLATLATQDGIWSLVGSDYITINGIDLTDPNTNNPSTMEYGYALFRASATNGCQNNTIKNCVITLNRVNNLSANGPTADGSKGINMASNSISAQTSTLTITSAAGTNSNNKFYGNTIQNCHIGIALIGFAAASPFTLADTGNDVGGSSVATGNTIINFGGAPSPANASYGIRTLAQYNLNVSYNTIDNNLNGTGFNHAQVLRGISTSTATSANTTINSNTVSVKGGGTTHAVSAIENVAGSTPASNTITINNNIINNCTYGTATTGAFNAIINSGTASQLSIAYNSVTYLGIGGTGNHLIIETGSPNVASVLSNTIVGITLMGASGNCRVIKTTSPATSFIASNNVIDSVNYFPGTSSGNVDGIFCNNAATSVTITNNKLSKLQIWGTGNVTGIREGGSAGNKLISGNELYSFRTITVAPQGSGGGTYTGIICSIGNIDISNNSIYDIVHTGSVGVTINAINVTGGTSANIYKNKIYGLSSTGTGAAITGITSNGAAATNANIYNNLIGEFTATAAIGANAINGISLLAGATQSVSFNSVYLNAASSGTLFGSSAINANTSPTSISLRNNIFVNTSTPSGTGITAAFRKSSTSLTNYDASSNNNLFYAGTPTASNVIFYNSSATYSTLALYKTAMTTRDGLSVTENPSFVTTVGSNSNFLSINTVVPTQIESGAIPIATITDDFIGTTRNATTPDIGAWEGNYLPMDITPPAISGLGFTSPACNTTSRSFTATISDVSGIASGANAPRVYYALNAGAYTSVAGTLTSGTALNGTWTFSMSFLGAAADIISYYVVAQDLATTPNTSALPAAGFSGTGVNTVTTPPTTPGTFVIGGTLNGLYTVGTAGSFTTLAAAANAYNTYCITGPVTFELTNTLYAASTGETFPILFQNTSYASTTNSLLIRPATGVAAVVTSSVSSVIKFLNARYITVDGLNTGGSSLTINSTNTGTSAVVWLASTATTGPGNISIAIKSCAITGGNTASGSYGIIAAVNGTSPSVTAGLDNDNITVSSNTIVNVYYGIYVRGTVAASAGGDNNWVISNNIIGPAAAGSNATGGSGILLQNAINPLVTANIVRFINTADITMSGIFLKTNVSGAVISQNTITNISSSSTGTDIDAIAGIYMGTGVNTSTLSANYISSVENTRTSGYAARGIILNTGATASVAVVNNMISDIISYSDADLLYWPVGIALEGSAGGITLDFNSISLSGSHAGLTGATGSAPLLLNSAGTLIMRNNILSNTYNNSTSTTDIAYAVYSENTASSFSTVDYNDYYVGGTGNVPVLGSLDFTDFLTLATFQTGFGSNVNSKTIAPVFTSVTDLHLPSAANALLDNLGTPLAGIITDIDNQSRNATTPDMGADEFSGPSCTSAVGGTIAPASFSICAGQTFTLNSIGTSTGNTTSYQWKIGTTVGTHTNVANGSGATTTSYINNVLTSGTYYLVLETTCAIAGLTNASNEVTVTVQASPTASASVSATFICAGSNLNFSGGTNFGTSYLWAGPNSFTSSLQNPVITAAVAAASGNYTLTVSANNCSSKMVIPVLVSAPPTALTVTPASAAICSGASQTLSVSGGTVGIQLNVGTQAGVNTATADASTDYPAPYQLWYGGQRMQLLILASELSAAGFANGTQLTSAQFPVVSMGSNWPGTALKNFRVSLASTTLTALTAFQSGLTIVKAAANYTPSVGYNNTHPFTAATFIWDGVSNIILETTFSNNTIGSANDAVVQYNSPTSFPSCIVYRDDSQSAAIMASGTTVDFAYSARPDFRLNGVNIGSYLWTPSTGLSSSTIAAVTATPATSTTYTVTYSNSSCGSVSSTVAINVAPTPTLSITSPTAVCIGNSATLSASGASSYTWNTTPTPTTDIVVSPTSNTTYTLTGAVGSCTARITKSIIASASPTVGATITNTLVCSGAPVTITGSGATAYTVSGGVSSGVPFAASATTNYTVTGANAAGCTGTTVKSLSVNATPTISFSGASGVCTGQTATVIANGADTYSWATGETTNSIVTTPPSSTTYTVTGTNVVGGCTATATQFVSVSNVLSVVISGPTVACSGQPALLTASGGLTYTWSTGATTSTIAPATTINNTSYTVSGASGTCSNTAVATVSIIANPTVSITGPLAVCAGQSVALTGNGALTYTWSTSATTQSVSVTPVGTTNYTVTGKGANGCTASAIAAVSTNTLPTITIAQTSTAVCSGSSATLTASGATSYTWTGGPATSTRVVSPIINTVYTVNGADAIGCVGSKTVAVVSNSLPVVVVTPASPTICATSTLNLIASGSSTYAWVGGPLTASNVVNPSTTTTYSVTGTNTTGCSSVKLVTVTTNTLPAVAIAQSATSVCLNSPVSFTASGANTYTWSNAATTTVINIFALTNPSYTVTGKNAQNCTATAVVTVNILALPVVGIAPNLGTVCVNAPVTYTATGAATYSWINNPSTGSTAVFSSPTAASYSVIGTDLNGCSARASNIMFVNPLPVITVAASSATICALSPVTFTAAGADTYSWSTGAATDAVTVNPSSSADVYTVTGTNAITGCAGTETVAVVTNPLPVVVVTPASTIVCMNTSVVLAASGADSYSWAHNGSVNASVNVTPTITTTYSVTGTDLQGCAKTETALVTVNALPAISISPASPTICANTVTTFTATGAANYSWTPGAVTTDTYVATLTASTVYTITGTDANNCVGRLIVGVNVTECTGIKTNTFPGNAVNIYPNPSNGMFTAMFDFEGNKTITVTNSVGQLVAQTTTASSSETFDLSGFAKGVYFVKVSTKNASGNYKLIIE